MVEAAGAGESFSAEMERQHMHPQVGMEKMGFDDGVDGVQRTGRNLVVCIT